MPVKKGVRDQRPVVAETPDTEGEELEAGGEGEGAPVTEPEGEVEPGAPRLVKITYAGNEFEVPANLAEVWQKREQEFQQRLSTQGSELGEVRREIAHLRGQVSALPRPEAKKQEPPADPEPVFDYAKYEQLSLESPTEALKLTHEHQRHRDAWLLRQNERAQENLRSEYQKDQAARQQQTAWQRRLDQFYKDNPDLEHDEDMVDLTYQRLVKSDPAVRDLVTQGRYDEVFKTVADETRKRILGYAGRKGESPRPISQGGRVAVAEGGGGPTGQSRGKGGEAEDEGPKSVSAVIKAKQARHRGAHQGRPDAARRAER